MKKLISILTIMLSLLLSHPCGLAQIAKKPTIMVVPATDWCQRNGYVDAYGNSDYKKALTNRDIQTAIAVIGDYMASQDYPMLSLEQGLSNAETEEVYAMLMKSKDGYGILENDLDQVSLYGSSDIIMPISLDWSDKGPKKSLEVRLTTLDSASQKILHGDNGQSSESSAPVGKLVMEAVETLLPKFMTRIDSHFESLKPNGREGRVVFRIAEDCPLNMESTVSAGGQEGELAEYLEYWLDEHCVNGLHSGKDKSRTSLVFKQVMIPLVGKARFGNKERALDADSFIREMQKDLESFGLSMSTVPVGIGKVLVTLGAAD